MSEETFCPAEVPHVLEWLSEDFAFCHGCDLLYVKQTGVLVWVYDVWSCRLAEELMAARSEIARLKDGISPADVDDIMRAAADA